MSELVKKAEHLLECKEAQYERKQSEVIVDLAKAVEENRGGVSAEPITINLTAEIDFSSNNEDYEDYIFSITEEEFAKFRTVKDTDTVIMAISPNFPFSGSTQSYKALVTKYYPATDGEFASLEGASICYIDELYNSTTHKLSNEIFVMSFNANEDGTISVTKISNALDLSVFNMSYEDSYDVIGMKLNDIDNKYIYTIEGIPAYIESRDERGNITIQSVPSISNNGLMIYTVVVSTSARTATWTRKQMTGTWTTI